MKYFIIGLLTFLLNKHCKSQDLYWIGNSGAWEDGMHWSLSSGGLPCNLIPDSTNNVIFDQLSFDTTSVITMVGAKRLRSVNMNGVNDSLIFNATQAYSYDYYYSGLVLSSSSSLSGYLNASGVPFYFKSNDSTNTLQMNGCSLISDFTYMAGGWLVVDSLNAPTLSILIFGATLQFNNDFTKVDGIYAEGGRLNLRQTKLFLRHWYAWNPNFILNADESVFHVRGGNAFHTYGLTYNVVYTETGIIGTGIIDSVIIHGSSSGFSFEGTSNYVHLYGSVWFSGKSTLQTLVLEPGNTFYFSQNDTLQVDTLVSNGNDSSSVFMVGLYHDFTRTAFILINDTAIINYTNIQGMHTDPAVPVFFSQDLGFNSGFIFDTTHAPPVRNMYWVGGSGNWNDPSHWALVSGGTGNNNPPGINDVVFIDTGSLDSTNSPITISGSYGLCRRFSVVLPDTLSELSVPAHLTVAGSMSSNVLIRGREVMLISNLHGNLIQLDTVSLYRLVVAGSGSYILNDIKLTGELWVLNGKLSANATFIRCGGFYYCKSADSLELVNTLVDARYWRLETEQPQNVSLNGTTIHISDNIGYYYLPYFDYGSDYKFLSSPLINYDSIVFSGNLYIKCIDTASVLTFNSIIGGNGGSLAVNGSVIVNNIVNENGNISIGSNSTVDNIICGGLTLDGKSVIRSARVKYLTNGSNVFGDNTSPDTIRIDSLHIIPGGSCISNYTPLKIGVLSAIGTCGNKIFIWGSPTPTDYSIPTVRNIFIESIDSISYCYIQGVELTDSINVLYNCYDEGYNFNLTFAPMIYQTFYWVGGSGDFNDPYHWSLTSGGAPCYCVPDYYVDVVFDANSFLDSSGTCMISADNYSSLPIPKRFRSFIWQNDSVPQQAYISGLLCSYGSVSIHGPGASGLSFDLYSRNDSAFHLDAYTNLELQWSALNGVELYGGNYLLVDSLHIGGMVIYGGSFSSKGKPITALNGLWFSNIYLSDSLRVDLDSSEIHTGQWYLGDITNIDLSIENTRLYCRAFYDDNGLLKYGYINLENDNRYPYYYHQSVLNFSSRQLFVDTLIAKNLHINYFYYPDSAVQLFVNTCISDGYFSVGRAEMLVNNLTLNPGSVANILGNILVDSVFTAVGTQNNPIQLYGDDSPDEFFMDSGIVCSDFLVLNNVDAVGNAFFIAGLNSIDNGSNTGWVFDSPYDFRISDYDIDCSNSSGVAFVTAGSCSGNLAYLWSTGSTVDTISYLSPGIYTLTVTDSSGVSSVRVFDISDSSSVSCTIDMQIKFFIEGLFSGNGLMRPALFNSGLSVDSTAVGVLSIEFRSLDNPFSVYLSVLDTLRINGIVQLDLPAEMLNESYYVVIKARSSIETWSKFPVIITKEMIVDFTSQNP